MNIRGLIFDLDGTLIDNFGAIYESYRYALERLGVARRSFAEVKKSVGGSVEVTMAKFAPPETVDRGVALFRERFEEVWTQDLKLLDGVAETLPKLTAMGLCLGIATNKRGAFARKTVEHLGISKHFMGVIGVLDVPQPKPHPEMVNRLLQLMGLPTESVLLIGDSPFDIETARQAKLRAWCLPTGAHEQNELEAAKPERLFSRFEELPGLIGTQV